MNILKVTPASFKLIGKYLILCVASSILMGSQTASAEEDGVYDDIQSLMPSKAAGAKAIPHRADGSEIKARKEDIVLGNPADDSLMWRFRAKKMYDSGANQYKIPVLEEQENEMKRTGGWQRRNIYAPTHVYLAVGDEITIDVKNYPSTTTTCSANTFDNFDKPYQPSEVNRLVLGSNSSRVYRATLPGLLMLACVDTNRDMNNWSSFNTFVDMSTSPPKTRSSLYIYGVTPVGQWPGIARSPDPSGQVYLFNGRTVFNFPAPVAVAHADKNIDVMMQEHLVITSSHDHLNGLTFEKENPSPLERPSLSMYQASFNTCCSSSYHNGRIGINFGGDRIRSFWGDWHEYGHQNQPAWKWAELTEVSVNLFSFEACQKLTGRKPDNFSLCEGSFITFDPEAIGRFLEMDGMPDIPPENHEANKLLLMLAQLYTSYPDWHAQLARDFRIAYDRGANAGVFSTDPKKKNWFVVNTSRIVGRDLRGFFDKWQLAYSATARQAIIDLNLPQPIRPTVQYSAEWALPEVKIIEGSIAVPPLVNGVGLVAYSSNEGPTTIVSNPEGSFTLLTTLVVGARRIPHAVFLRGTLRHGSCDREYPINANVACVSNDRHNYWKLTYVPSDNQVTLPEDNYEGVLRLAIRSGQNVNWGGTLTIPIKLTVKPN